MKYTGSVENRRELSFLSMCVAFCPVCSNAHWCSTYLSKNLLYYIEESQKEIYSFSFEKVPFCIYYSELKWKWIIIYFVLFANVSLKMTRKSKMCLQLLIIKTKKEIIVLSCYFVVTDFCFHF